MKTKRKTGWSGIPKRNWQRGLTGSYSKYRSGRILRKFVLLFLSLLSFSCLSTRIFPSLFLLYNPCSFIHPFICLSRSSSSRFFALFFKSSSPLRHLLFFSFVFSFFTHLSSSFSSLPLLFSSTFDFTFPLHISLSFLTISSFFLPPSSFPLPSLLLPSNSPTQPYSLLITPLTPYDLRERFCPLSVSSSDQPATASFPLQLTPNTTSRAERPEGVAARSSIASATVALQASCFFLSTPPGDRVLRTISSLSNRTTAKIRMKIPCSILIIKIRRMVELCV